jgi:glycerol-3-phosphate acyltransferase PlsY
VTLDIVLTIIVAYLFGAIPFGVLVARTYTVDIRRVGSGNPGAANVMRAVGWKPALVVALADIFKGGLAVMIPRALGMPDWQVALVAVVAVIGHNYSFLLGFKGGKGVATSFGTVAFLDIGLGLSVLPVFIFTAWVTRFSSAGSIVSSFAAVVLGIAMKREWWFVALLGVLFAMIMLRHRENLERLMNGTERRFDQRSS